MHLYCFFLIYLSLLNYIISEVKITNKSHFTSALYHYFNRSKIFVSYRFTFTLKIISSVLKK